MKTEQSKLVFIVVKTRIRNFPSSVFLLFKERA